MEHEAVLSIALFSGILGFVVFCVSYTFHVWRSRNAAVARRAEAAPGLADRAGVLLFGLLILGTVLLAVAVISRELGPREGVLSGDGLFTVRANQDLRLEYVTNSQSVEAGEVLARFRSPDRQARIKELRLKKQILEAQKQVISHQPVTPDPEIVRRYQKTDADRRQLLAALLHLVPERAVVGREKLRDLLDRTEKINKLNTELQKTHRQVEQATAELELSRRYLKRNQSLAAGGAVAPIELDDRATEVAVLEAEVAKLESTIETFTREKEFIEAGMPEFQALAQQQVEQLDREISQARKNMTQAQAEQENFGEQLDRDLKRAEQLQRRLLQQIDLEIQQCQANLDGLEDVLVIRAPFRGRVAYADPAPQTALPREPVVVLSPEKGFRLFLRLAESEVSSLSAAGPVRLALVDPILRRRFPGRLLTWEQLPDEPGYALAELTCLPPTETICELTSDEDETIEVRLVWRPPLHTTPLFLPAVISIALGAVGRVLMKIMHGRKRSVVQEKVDPALVAPWESTPDAAAASLVTGLAKTEVPMLREPDLEDPSYGLAGRNIRLLGQRLREAIKREDVDAALLGAVEWALDRHHARAVQFLVLGMDHDPEFPPCVERYMARLARDVDKAGPTKKDETRSTRDRLFRILKVTAPKLLAGSDGPLVSSPYNIPAVQRNEVTRSS